LATYSRYAGASRQPGSRGRPDRGAAAWCGFHLAVARGRSWQERRYHSGARGPLTYRMQRGVYAVGHGRPPQEGIWLAAVLACGALGKNVSVPSEPVGDCSPAPAHPDLTISVLGYWNAALSYRSAACLWGLIPPHRGPVDISIPGLGGKGKRRGIRLHRSLTLLPATVTLRSGIPVTTPSRTISDLRRAVGKAGRSGLVSPRELRRAIRQANFLGLPIDEEARRERTRSDLEMDFQELCRRFGLSPPEINVRVGPHLVDFYWRQRGLVVETDGYSAHRGRAAFEDDRGRDLDLRARGLEVIHIAEKQLNEEPRRVAEVVGAALRVRADGR
jgi:very-short-patch-repair endonuclease